MFLRRPMFKKFEPGVDISNPRCFIIKNHAYRGNPEVARIYRVDEGHCLPHYVVLETGREADSGIAVSYRVPGEEPRKLGDREPLFVNASTRVGLGFPGEKPMAQARVSRSDPRIEVEFRELSMNYAGEYEAQFDYRGLEDLREDITGAHFWIGKNSFVPGSITDLWTSYRTGAIKAFSLFGLRDNYILVNDGSLHLLVNTDGDSILSKTPEGRNIERPNCEYLERGRIITAYPDYVVYFGLSPVQPGIGFKLNEIGDE